MAGMLKAIQVTYGHNFSHSCPEHRETRNFAYVQCGVIFWESWISKFRKALNILVKNSFHVSLKTAFISNGDWGDKQLLIS